MAASPYLLNELQALRAENARLRAERDAFARDLEELAISALRNQDLIQKQSEAIQQLILKVKK